MIKLHGFALSNYYNKVKLALLEKGVPFEEVPTLGGGSAQELALSPVGKVPYLVTPQGPLCESQVILDWIEATYPQPALLPADPWAAAKLRELVALLELHLELVARELYPQAFFGMTLPERFVQRIGRKLEHNIVALRARIGPQPYFGSAGFTLADCAAYAHLPTIGITSQLVLGEDLLLRHGIDWKSYARLIEQRPSAQRVAADRKADRGRAVEITAKARALAAL
jgi:glutathione S-transferase